MEIKGKHDAEPHSHYTCYDDEGLALPITPGAEWRLVKTEKVCFLHRVRDTIRVCMEITPVKDNSSSCYTCSIGDEPPKPFEPTRKWEKLAADDKRCAPHLQSFDVPRTMVILTLPDWEGTMQNKNNPFPLTGVLDFSAITGLVVGLLYTAGWSYAYHYFARFHLGITGLEISRDTLFIYSLWVLKDSLAAAAACFGLYFLLRYLWQCTAIQQESDSDGEETAPPQVIKRPL